MSTADFLAFGVFSNGAIRDITNPPTTLWTSSDTAVLPPEMQQGLFSAASPGCACVTASAGGLSSDPVNVTVFQPSASPTPSCLCPTPVPAAVAPGAASEVEQPPLRTASRPALAWTFEAGAAIRAPIVVGEDGSRESVYFASADGVLHALTGDGAPRWRARARAIADRLAPAGVLYALGDDAALLALSPDGTVRWRFADASAAAPAVSPPPAALAVAPDGTLYATSSRALLAITADGALKWRVEAGEVAALAPLPDGGVAAVGQGALTAFAADGVERWRFAPEGGLPGAVAVSQDRIYLGGADGRIHLLSLDGTVLQGVAAQRALRAGPTAASDGGFYFLTDSLHKASADGVSQWEQDAGRIQGASLWALRDGEVAVTGRDARIDVLDSERGRLWGSRLSGAITAVASGEHGALYVATANGRLYAIR